MARDAFNATFKTLRAVLKRHGKKLVVTADTPTDFMVASGTMTDRSGRPLFVAGVQIRKQYVSYHLMPVYGIPALAKTISPGLRKRMQGKACFNFTTIEPAQAKELSSLTKAGIARFANVRLPWAHASKK
jgi:hypothetical protein